MRARRWVKYLICITAVLAFPVIALSGEATTAPLTKSPKKGKKTVVKEQPQPAAGHTQKLERVREILAQMKDEMKKYQYGGLYLAPGDKPVSGLAEFPAEKFGQQVDELDRIASECRKQMQARQTEARAQLQKINAPQAAVFSSCEEGMADVERLIDQLRGSASYVIRAGAKGADYYVEVGRAERTIAQISALVEVCAENMKRADMVCADFESKVPRKKSGEALTY